MADIQIPHLKMDINGMLHSDKYNIILCSICLLGMSYTHILRLLFGLAGLCIYIIKYYGCKKYKSIYNYTRKYMSSTLKPHKSGSYAEIILKTRTAYDDGYALGSLLCYEIIYQVLTMPHCNVNINTLRNIDDSLPVGIKHELMGMHAAILNKTNSDLFQITYFDLLLLQIMPEINHNYNMSGACVISNNLDGSAIIAKNLDQLTYKKKNNYVVVHYKRENYSSIVTPGMIGVVTGWRKNYLLILNNKNNETILNSGNMPCALFTKDIIRKYETFANAYKYAENSTPLNSCDLILSNNKTVYWFYYCPEKITDIFVHKFNNTKSVVLINGYTMVVDNINYLSVIRFVINIIQSCNTYITKYTLLYDNGNICIQFV